ncbi:Pkinase-domain-containing protein [Mycena latifolia]|nr:Pkinase-domain-containing protein [Mycena latifolia]
MPSHRAPAKASANSGASTSRLPTQPPTATLSVSAAPGAPEPAPKTFHRIRSSLEQSLRTATRSKKTAQPVVGDYVTISTGASKGKERENSEDVKDKEKTKALWFRRGGRQSVTPSPSPIPPSPVVDRANSPLTGYVAPTLRRGSMSSPALHLYSQALPSPKSQPAIPASSSSTSDALVSPIRERPRRPSLQPIQRNLTDLPPTTPARERVSRHRATKSNPLNSITMAPTAPTRVASSPVTPRKPTRETPPTPPDTPTPMSGSRGHMPRSSSSASVTQPGHMARSSSSASVTQPPLKSTPISVPRGTSPIRPRSPSNRRVVTPLRGLSSTSASHLPLSSSPVPPSPTGLRPSIDSPRRPSFRDESPSPMRPRDRTPSQQRPAYANNRQFNVSTTSLSPPSNPEHRDLIRTATSMLCKEVVKPPVHMSRTEAGLRDWDEVEVRVRALARLERIWGKSGIGSSSNLTLGTPAGVSVGGEERERRLFTEALKDGFVLCQLMNKLRSSSIVRPDVRDDGFVRTSNITKFLAACSSYGLPNEDLFQRDDLIEATSESLARVAKTIIALIKYVDAPVVERSKYVSGGQANKKASAPSSSSNPYGQGTSRTAASTPNLHSPPPPSPTPLARKRWSPPSDLPTWSDANGIKNRRFWRILPDLHSALNRRRSVPDSIPVSPGLERNSRQSVVSTSSAMTGTTTTTMMSSLLDITRPQLQQAPSITRTEGSAIAEDIARKRAEPKLYTRETKLSESFIDLSRVEEMDEAGTASRGIGRKWEQQQQPPPEVQRLDKPAIRLGKGKWPDDFMDALQPPKSPTTSDVRSPSPSVISGPRKLAIVGATKQRNESVESLPQFPRRPTHRARHSIDTPVLLPKDSLMRRDSSPDGMPGGSRVMPRRHSTKPGMQRSGSLVPRSDSRERSSDSLVPFPRTASGEHSPASSSPPERATSPLADKPRLPRGRFQSDVEGTSRRRPRPSSYDELGAKPTRSRFESMMNLGVASGNTSASDLLTRDSLDGSFVRQALIIREEGKPPTHFQLGNCIGRGQFGSVYRALNLNTGQMVAVKRIRLEGLKEDEVTTLMREVDLVKSLSHPSIVKYEGMARDQDTLSIVLEYAENGSLGQTLKAFGKLNERLVASYVVKILEGLHYLHSSDVNGNVKLSDFGVSLNLRAMEREIKDVAGTPNWMAPECTVIELLTGRPPYAEIANSMSVMFRIVEDDMPPLPEGASPLLEDFLTQCFNKDPRKRPSADLLCEHQELRPQDSIPFLRRVSADLQKSDAVDGDDPISGSPPGRRISLSSRPMDQDISPRDHSFVKTTFSKPMVLIAHSKCAVNAPPTCDLRAQLLLYAQYAEKGNPGSAYSNPLDAANEPHSHPMSPVSEVAYVSHTPRTSLDGTAPGPGPSHHGPNPATPPTAFKFMAAFKRSRSNLSPEPDHASSSGKIVLKSVKSTSTTANTSSLRSGESVLSRANPKSLDETRSTDMQRKRSRLNSKSAPSEVTATDLDAPGTRTLPGGLPPETRHKKRSESRSSNCIVQ